MKRSMWLEGFLQAEDNYKQGYFVEDINSGRLNFVNPCGGSVEYLGYQEASYQFERGMRDYHDQYENVIKEILND